MPKVALLSTRRLNLHGRSVTADRGRVGRDGFGMVHMVVIRIVDCRMVSLAPSSPLNEVLLLVCGRQRCLVTKVLVWPSESWRPAGNDVAQCAASGTSQGDRRGTSRSVPINGAANRRGAGGG